MRIHRRVSFRSAWQKTLFASLLVLVPTQALAQSPETQPLRLHGEGGLGFMLNEPYRSRFDNGVNAIARLGLDLTGPLSVQVSVANLWLPAHEGERGRMYTLEGGLRASFSEGRGLAGGPVIDLNAGVGFTGDLRRVVVDPGIGWELVFADWIAGGPMLRYMQVIQPPADPQPKDGRIFLAGIGLTFGIPVRTTTGSVDDDAEPRDRLAMAPTQDPDPEEQATISELSARTDDTFVETVEAEPEMVEPPPALASAPPPPPAPLPPSTISLKERIQFARGRAQLDGSENAAALQDVCRRMKADERLTLRITGHADETGSAGFNQALSAQRAGAVSQWMVKNCEISPSRVEIAAYGDSRPICSDGGASCHAKNRRVEFELIER